MKGPFVGAKLSGQNGLVFVDAGLANSNELCVKITADSNHAPPVCQAF